MELLFVVIGGVFIGALVRYLVPGRRDHGAALVPAIGGIAASAIWAILTWVGLRYDGGWIWVISLVAAAAASLAVALVLPRRRARTDAALLERLSRA